MFLTIRLTYLVPLFVVDTLMTHITKNKNPLHSALVKATIGAVAGGVMGLIAFKGGKGTRAASIATGIGAGLGSTWERVKFRYEQQENK